MSSPDVLWSTRTTAMNTLDVDSVPSIISDQTGNTYVTYQTKGTASGGTHLNTPINTDIVVLKMDSSGTLVWIKQQAVMNTTLVDTVPCIACDNSGNVYVAYQTTGTASGGTHLNISSNGDIVVFKMDSTGTLLWIKQQANMNTTLADVNPKITVDNNGNAYVAYQSSGTVSGGSFAGGSADIVIFKIQTDGILLWVKQQPIMNTALADDKASIAVDTNCNIYISYQTTGTASGGTHLSATAGADIVVFKMNTTISAPAVISLYLK